MKLAQLIQSRYSLILSGIIVGIYPNIYFGFMGAINLEKAVIIIASFLAVAFLAFGSWDNSKAANGKNLASIRKMRLFFFGISAASFALASIDVIQYFTSPIGSLQRFNGVWSIQGVPFSSIFISFAIGSLFSVVERLLDLIEKNDI
jgi:hypothetical protein